MLRFRKVDVPIWAVAIPAAILLAAVAAVARITRGCLVGECRVPNVYARSVVGSDRRFARAVLWTGDPKLGQFALADRFYETTDPALIGRLTEGLRKATKPYMQAGKDSMSMLYLLGPRPGDRACYPFSLPRMEETTGGEFAAAVGELQRGRPILWEEAAESNRNDLLGLKSGRR